MVFITRQHIQRLRSMRYLYNISDRPEMAKLAYYVQVTMNEVITGLSKASAIISR